MDRRRRLQRGGGLDPPGRSCARRSTAAGREDEPFTIYLSLNETPNLDMFRRFAEAGVTDFVCAPWMFVRVPPGTPDDKALADRLDAVTWFADEIVAKLSYPTAGERDMKEHEDRLAAGLLGLGSPPHALELVEEADRLGFDSVWTAESYGSDALTPLAWWGSRTERVRLGTSLCQLSARTPTAMAMAALTMDHLSGGRFVLGLGVSGPQVVEGWYGQPFPAPLARTREYVDIVRQVLAREKPVTNDGPHYPLPYPGGTGLGKPLKPIVHPLRADIPIILGAEGPKNVALAAEIADGWFPIFFSPKAMSSFEASLDEGFARPGARRSKRRLRGAGLRAHRDRRRRRARPPMASGPLRPLHRRHGGEGDELPLRRVRPHGLRGGGHQDPGCLPRRPQGRRGGGRAHRHGRGHRADRSRREDP